MKRFALILGLVLPSAFASGQATTPAVAPAAATVEHLKAKVTGVEGLVQVRMADDQPWQKATLDMEVGENAEFRTGPKSAVRFTIPPDQTVTLDRLGTVKVLTAISDNGKLTTNLGMKYGRTRYDIEAAGREHESTIASPSSTLAVRGTKVSLFDQRPFPAEAVSLTGRGEFRDFRKHVFFGNKGAGRTVVDTSDPSAPALAMRQTVVDPSIALARSRAETQVVQTLLSQGANVSFDYLRGIRVIQGGAVPHTDQALIPELPGALNFVLRWQGNANLNLAVVEPGNGPGHTVYPLAGFDLTKSGGHIPFDHRGGPDGGLEIVSWPAGSIPDGRYLIGSQHMSGPNVPATLDVFRDGVRVPIQTGGFGGSAVQTAAFIAMPIDPTIASGQAIGTVDIKTTAARKAPVAAKKVAPPLRIVNTPAIKASMVPKR